MQRPAKLGNRVPMSIMIDPDVKEKAQALAAFYNQSLAQHLEQLATDEIESVDAETWKLIKVVFEHLETSRKQRKTRRKNQHRE